MTTVFFTYLYIYIHTHVVNIVFLRIYLLLEIRVRWYSKQ